MTTKYYTVVNQSRPKTAPGPPPPPPPLVASSMNESAWRARVAVERKRNERAIERSDSHIYLSKIADPLTNLREVVRELSNSEAFAYMKQCRLIVARLKKCWLDVNEEVKALTRTKEYLESAVEHVRKDMIVNKEIVDARTLNRALNEPVRSLSTPGYLFHFTFEEF